MNKLELYRRISKIHAIKCNKTLDDQVAAESTNKTHEFKIQLEGIPDENSLHELSQKVMQWSNTNPIATEQEINQLLMNGK